jgi:DNA (cytosine-5)-methyltransferase 1
MKYLSVCAGIEAATVAWHPLNWEPVAFSEIDAFPSAVLSHHYPNVPNWGDMTQFKTWPDADLNLLVGGTPCQSFSVAGLRKGLDDPRGNLMLTYLAIADRYRPKWLVWENVPGVLSSSGGRDFGAFLGALGQLGYGFAYRVLDAQYFGVAQRRRRVFVVGYLGDWRRAAAVLFERESLSGHPAPSREKRQKPAGTIAARFGISRNNAEECVATVSPSITGGPPFSRTGNERVEADALVVRGVEIGPSGGRYTEVAPTMDTRAKDGPMRNQVGARVVQGVRMTAFGEYVEDGTASAMKARDYKDATDLVVQPVQIYFNDVNGTRKDRPNGGLYVTENPETAPALTCADSPINVIQAVAFGAQNSASQGISASEHITPTLDKSKIPAVAFGGDVARTLSARHDGSPCADRGPDVVVHPVAPALTASNDPSRSPQSSEVTQQVSAVYAASSAVRRLTPVECERLQGFPDNYTAIPYRGKPADACPDSPRYKALGNSMAVPVMAWIGRRIQLVHDL